MTTFLAVFEHYPAVAYTMLSLFGLCIGSFMNVCIYRWPLEKAVSKGRSYCPKCETLIRWYDNLPVLSYLLLRGKCRKCATRISARYPVIEILTAILLSGSYYIYGPSWAFLIFSYFVCSLLIATVTDWEHQIIPDEVSLMGILLGLTVSFFVPEMHGETAGSLSLARAAGGMLVGIWTIYGTAIFGQIVFRKEAMGGGDIKLLAMIGVFLGWEKTLFTFFAAPFIAAPIGLVLKSWKKADVIAFGPYLAMMAFVALVWGEDILNMILRWYNF